MIRPGPILYPIALVALLSKLLHDRPYLPTRPTCAPHHGSHRRDDSLTRSRL